MPDLDQTVADDILLRLKRYLSQLGGYDEPIYLGAGGSAAVYRVNCSKGLRVFKGFNPSFFNGSAGAPERKRLDIQRRLINHQCPSIVQTYRVEEAEGTAFIEMEYLPWPSLKSELPNIPDNAVAPLIMQLVEAVKYLDGHELVHRDIKPENIHISADFQHLKLLDLGVAREFEATDTEDAALTDHGKARPFLATAQYSSPEYLFRLDAPSAKLWKGLNFYQVGAVLHDLIMKQPLFQHEMEMQNRWLVARAVLTKTPSFSDSNPNRLSSLKALAARCLVKDIELRLQLVGWEDFVLGSDQDPIATLKERLAKHHHKYSAQAAMSAENKLDFEKMEWMKRITNGVRTELIDTCQTSLPLRMISPDAGGEQIYKLIFSTPIAVTIYCEMNFNWDTGFASRTASIFLNAQLSTNEVESNLSPKSSCAIGATTIAEAEEISIKSISAYIARVLANGLDLLEGADQPEKLIGIDLLSK